MQLHIYLKSRGKTISLQAKNIQAWNHSSQKRVNTERPKRNN